MDRLKAVLNSPLKLCSLPEIVCTGVMILFRTYISYYKMKNASDETMYTPASIMSFALFFQSIEHLYYDIPYSESNLETKIKFINRALEDIDNLRQKYQKLNQ